MIKQLSMLVALSGLLAGCQAPGAALTAAPIAEPAPQTVSAAKVRRLLSTAAGSAALWGINYTLSYREGTAVVQQRRKGHSGRWVRWWERYNYAFFQDNAVFSGKSGLLKASYNRFVYKVPADQVLVINRAEGVGTVYVNGFGLGLGTVDRGVHYLFGPGEDVVFQFSPAVQQRTGSSDGPGSDWTTHYHPIHLSGFTVSPSLLAGTGALGPGAVK